LGTARKLVDDAPPLPLLPPPDTQAERSVAMEAVSIARRVICMAIPYVR
jgi:hypothetical protein